MNEATLAKALETIQQNATLQGKLIDDILDISRIVQGKIQLNTRPVHLVTVINAAIENIRPTTEIKGIQVESLLDPEVGQIMGDPERLQQIMWNLLSNAVKFTPSSGRVEVRLESVDSMAQITVRDTGKGISADVLPCIFERFRQAEPATTRVYGGLGLGLAIVRYLVEMHSGTVYAASEGEGMGATFTVQFPLMESQKVLPLDEKPLVLDNIPSLDGLRVLVVDDQRDTLELIAFILSEYGADVRTAASASEALDAIAQSVPDILISDIGMPEEDGYSLLARVRALPAEQGGLLPAIALTAFAREEERVRALKAGFSRHVPKPVEPAELVIVAANLAGRI
jgi:CheY-like chemotaxis protein